MAAYVATPVQWRTSTPGADLMTLFLPNPNHPWLGAPWREWLTGQPGGFAENVTSVTLVAAAVVLAAVWLARFRIPRFWGGLALLAGSLTLGPFIRVADVATYLPTPWAVLRYVPVIGTARAPARFAVLLTLAVAVLFALALAALADRRAGLRRPVVALVGLLLAIELCPAPRPLFDGTIAPVYAQIASDPRDVRVLELPFGVRDGLTSFGDFSAASQFHQTLHGKRLVGGYLSRVSNRRFEMARRRPVLAVLAALSEGRDVSPAELEEARRRGPEFVDAARIGYVVVDRSRASQALVAFATSAFSLEKIAEADHRELYRPRPPGAITASMSAPDTAGPLRPSRVPARPRRLGSQVRMHDLASQRSAGLTRSGVSGSRVILAPVASKSAFAITAAMAVIVGSPHPCGASSGLSTRTSSIAGTCEKRVMS